MALADSVHALALEVYAKRPAGVAPTAWLTDSKGVPAHRVAAQLVKQAAVLEGLTAHVGLDFALGDLLARLREAVTQYAMYIEEVGEVDQTQKVRREQVEAEKKRVKAEVVVVSDEEEDAPLSKRVKTKPVSPPTPAPAPRPAPQLLLSGSGSGHPRIFVQKRNSCIKNQQELFSRFRKGEVSIEWALICMQPRGALRRNWKATQDDFHAHIDTLYKFAERLRARVRNGTYDGTPGYLTAAPETYQFYYGGFGGDGDGGCG